MTLEVTLNTSLSSVTATLAQSFSHPRLFTCQYGMDVPHPTLSRSLSATLTQSRGAESGKDTHAHVQKVIAKRIVGVTLSI